MKANKIHWIIPAVLVTLLLAFWWPPFLSAPANVYDESMLLVAPDLVRHGKVAYRDFGTYYGPGNLWILALAYKLAEPSIVVERLVGILYRLGYLAALGAVCWRIQPRLTWLVLLAAVTVTIPLSLMAMAWIPAVALGLYSLVIACKAERDTARDALNGSRSSWMTGLLMGIGLLFRPDTAPAALLGLLPIFLIWNWKSRFSWAMGMIIGLFPLAVQTWVATPMQIWNNLFYHPVILASPARQLPLASAPPIVQILVAITILLCLLNLASGLWWRYAKNSTAKDLLFLSASLFGAGLTHQLLQRCDPWHVAMGMMVTAPLAVIALHRWLEPWLKRGIILPATTVMTAILLSGLGFYKLTGSKAEKWSGFSSQARKLLAAPSYLVTFGERTFPTSHPIMRDRLSGLLRFLDSHSRAGEKVFVGPGDLRRTQINDIFLYYLLMPKLQPGSYYVELNPLVANAEDSGLADDLRECDWIILNCAWDSIQEPNRSREQGSAKPVLVLQNHFKEVFQDGPFIVYKKE